MNPYLAIFWVLPLLAAVPFACAGTKPAAKIALHLLAISCLFFTIWAIFTWNPK